MEGVVQLAVERGTTFEADDLEMDETWSKSRFDIYGKLTWRVHIGIQCLVVEWSFWRVEGLGL